ncbi:DJ-1/PfpI family protein [Streptomyces triticirhizae]|uniref:DJ-1/PfpI family protein n=1 Tax=Streptomyces triticirhizae TaxID=2483353 RepID=A0A3M2L3J5_9ACTN|nr:DJ-1/PfpI family protein [Streptomyces triticirhizae]RMI31556.1 DJ-1/PfpI family protein [Streptomyces triticirhizae]
MTRDTHPHATHPNPRPTHRRTFLTTTAATTVLAGAATLGAAPAPARREPAPHEAATGRTERERNGPRVGILLYPGFTLLDATGPTEVLGRLPDADVALIGERRGQVRTDTGDVAVTADLAVDEVERLDVLLVPGGGIEGVVAAIDNPALLNWIRRVHRHTRWTTSVCTGSVILAAAGLLTGRRATTHWASAEYIESTYGVAYVAERFVRSGKLLTSAGVSAGIDMALLLAAELAGEEVARAAQLALEYDPAPPFDSGNAAEASQELRDLALRLLADSTAG